jgi:AcrR family transcriptional regulator
MTSELATTRKEQILTAARSLFRQRGYHAATIDEIGTTVGITGPAIYRHFNGKAALLVEIFESATTKLYRSAQQAQIGREGFVLLDVLVQNHVQFAIHDRDLIAVYAQEERSLPDSDKRRLRNRQREYVNIWIEALRRERPELSDAELRDRVYAVIALVASVGNHEARTEPDRLESVLADMAGAALRAGNGQRTGGMGNADDARP